jgi:DNA-binding response OmpR family regulator
MKTILLVDDDKQIATVFQIALTSAGYKVMTANDGKTGLNMVRQQHFDLVLLDEMMPDMSGNDVLRSIKEDDATKAITVVILSNFGNNDMVKEALNLGAADYMLKYQVSPTDLPAKVKQIVGE